MNNNPNIPQKKASNPFTSVWVSASAGTGKTKILIDRIIKLLLYNTKLSEIICITYTDNAAKEMKDRLLKTFSKFAILNDVDLKQELYNLLEKEPSEEQIDIAKKIFIYAINNPQNIKIQTIHSFCQTILSRFPNESNVPINFENIEGEISDKLKKIAIEHSLKKYIKKEILTKNKSQNYLTFQEYTQDTLYEKIFEMLNNTLPLIDIINLHNINKGISDYKNHLCKILNINSIDTSANLASFFFKNIFDLKLFSNVLVFLNSNNLNFSGNHIKKNKLEECLTDIAEYIHTNDNVPEKCVNFLRVLYFKFTTEKSGVRHIKKIFTKDTINKIGNHIAELFTKEVEKLFDAYNNINKYLFMEHNLMFMELAADAYNNYEKFKLEKGYLDYNDQIYKTSIFLNNSINIMPWIMFKLDSEINHILVDEAQDTSPKQWEIINFFIKEFFSGESAFDDKKNISKLKRTLFVVGDLKQSIYNFQGANASEFINKRQTFKELVLNSNNAWEEVNMKTSFRSAAGVIKAINLITNMMFKHNKLYQFEDLEHIPFKDFSSSTEIWPVIEDSIIENTTVSANYTRFFKASYCIVKKIQELVATKNINYADIVILYTKRNNNFILPILTKDLKDNNIPVLGVDKLLLRSNIAILDLIALGQFILQHSDNMSLACVLKSPLFNLTDTDILSLTENSNTIFENLNNIKKYNHIHKTLTNWIKLSKEKTVYELYFNILYLEKNLQKFISRLGNDCIDILNDFLDLTLNFKSQQFESLQNFIFYITEENPDIKRDISTQENAITFSTIHGYKGLQNKVVFIINNLDEKILTSKLLIENQLMIYKKLPNIEKINEISNLNEKEQLLLLEEKYRLLYVAITRASHHLYICNISKKFAIEKANPWYHVFSNIDEKYTSINKKLPITIKNSSKYFYINHQASKSEENNIKQQDIDEQTLPSWLFSKYENVQDINSTLYPSRLNFDNKNYFSPLDKLSNPKDINIHKGLLIHKILEHLTLISYSPNNLNTYLYVLEQLLETHAKNYNLEKKDLEIIKSMIIKIINNPQTQFLFDKESLNEVSLSGIIDSKLLDENDEKQKIKVSGRIDKIIINSAKKLITIVDYKFSKFKEKPNSNYITQINIYKTIIEQIYPNYKIDSYLLYTIDCKLQKIL